MADITSVGGLSGDQAVNRRGKLRLYSGSIDRVLTSWISVFCSQLLLGAFVGRSVLWSSYNGDDVVNSQIPAVAKSLGVTWIQLFEQTNESWMKAHGRFFPVSSFETGFIFNLFQTRSSYKIAQFAAILVMYFFVLLLLYLLTKSKWRVSFLGLIFLALALQFRFFHDPLLSFALQQPTALLLLAVAFLIWLSLADGLRKTWLLGIFASALWLADLMLYETTYISAIGVVLLLGSVVLPRRILTSSFVTSLQARDSRSTRAFVLSAGVALAGLCCLLAVVLSLRSSSRTSSPAYTSDFAISRVFPAFLKQASGMVPLNYSLFDPASLKVGSALNQLGLFEVIFIVACLLPFVRLLQIRLAEGSRIPNWSPLESWNRRSMMVCGFALMVFPMFLTATTVRFQTEEIGFGRPYVSTTMSVFGFCVFLASLRSKRRSADQNNFFAISKASKLRTTVILMAAATSMVVATLLFGIQSTVNADSVNRWAGQLADQEAFDSLISNGLFNELDAGDIVVSETASNWYWENGAYLAWRGGPPGIVFSKSSDLKSGDCVSTKCFVLIRPDGQSSPRGQLVPYRN
jgi:hypothetical protein